MDVDRLSKWLEILAEKAGPTTDSYALMECAAALRELQGERDALKAEVAHWRQARNVAGVLEAALDLGDGITAALAARGE